MFKPFAALALLLAPLFFAEPVMASEFKNDGDYVVLLHGIARSSSHMNDLAKAFDAAGYRVINIDYPSTDKVITDLAAGIHPQIEAAAADKERQLHFVGYSMGGLITRAYLKEYRPENLGRVVMLGTPNKGSQVADFLRDNFLYKKIYGPAGQELVTGRDADALFGKVDYPLGIVAGTYSIDPISSKLIIKVPSDGKVSVESTKCEGMADHILLPASHTFMPNNKEVIAAALAFVKDGAFPKPTVPAAKRDSFNP